MANARRQRKRAGKRAQKYMMAGVPAMQEGGSVGGWGFDIPTFGTPPSSGGGSPIWDFIGEGGENVSGPARLWPLANQGDPAAVQGPGAGDGGGGGAGGGGGVHGVWRPAPPRPRLPRAPERADGSRPRDGLTR